MKDIYKDFYKTIGERIREIRIKAGITQERLAFLAGLSTASINSIENGQSMIWLISFAKIAEALGVSPDDILRLNTSAPSRGYHSEFVELLEGCNQFEAESIMKIARQMKQSLDTQKKAILED